MFEKVKNSLEDFRSLTDLPQAAACMVLKTIYLSFGNRLVINDCILVHRAILFIVLTIPYYYNSYTPTNRFKPYDTPELAGWGNISALLAQELYPYIMCMVPKPYSAVLQSCANVWLCLALTR